MQTAQSFQALKKEYSLSEKDIKTMWRWPVECWTIEPPGGMSEPNEPLEHAAARELLEETGYRANSLKLLAEVPIFTAGTNAWAAIFVANDCVKTQDPELDEMEEAAGLEVVEMGLTEIMQGAPGRGAAIDSILSHALMVFLREKFLPLLGKGELEL